MHAAINDLYTTFVDYEIGDDFVGCRCCVNDAESVKLAATPVRELSYNDLQRYSRKAISTWGGVEHFKHFLPRLLELSIEHRDDFLDLAVVFGKLKDAKLEEWPQNEQDSVNRFFDAYWQYQLAEPIGDYQEEQIDTVLCAISNAVTSVAHFLTTWTATRSENAKRHLASFILANDESLIIRAKLSNTFWDRAALPHEEVVCWLQSDAMVDYFDGPNDPVLASEFPFAWSQLTAIRAALISHQE